MEIEFSYSMFGIGLGVGLLSWLMGWGISKAFLGFRNLFA